MQVEKTVFISYRRTNVFNALAIYQNLTAHGFDVFFDYESIKSGSFEQIILNQIAARAHFVVLLTPSALERCNEPSDWLRREVEYALEMKRNIVPLMFEGFSFNDVKQYLTGKLAMLSGYNAMRVPADYFDAAMQRLRGEFLNTPLEIVIHPTPAADRLAVQQVQAAAAQQPEPTEKQVTAEEWFERGLRRGSKDYGGAIADYTEAIRLNPRYADAYNNRGIMRYLKGDVDGAIADYTEAIRLNPQFVFAYFGRGGARHTKGDIDGAITDFDEAIRLNPQYTDAYNLRGRERQAKGDTDGAITDFDEAIRLNPQYADAYNQRGVARQAKGDTDGAITDFDEAIRLNPQFALAYFGRGGARHMKRNMDAALADLTEAIRLDPQLASAYTLRGITQQIKGEEDRAVADFTEAIRLNPQNHIAYNHRGLGRIHSDQDGAIADLTEAIHLNPQYVGAYRNRGLAYNSKGDLTRANADYQKYFALGGDATAEQIRGAMLQNEAKLRQQKS